MTNRNLFMVVPGLAFCCAVAALIMVVTNQISKTIFDPLLIALMFGMAFNNIFPKAQWHIAGTKFAVKFVLEFSIMILGASIFLPEVMSVGSGLFVLILCGIIGSMAIAFFVGHIILKLSRNLSILIGVSNSICGNTAAMVMAPIIGATSVELTAAIAISGLLGAAQIILLPLLVPALGLGDYHYGIVAGMSVYAVAQVYAAAAIVSTTSASVATFVKLTRVALLAPLVVVVQFLVVRDTNTYNDLQTGHGEGILKHVVVIQKYAPWFVIGFLVLAALRSLEIIGEATGDDIRELSRYSFVVAMIAMGLGVDIRAILNVGARVVLVICSVLSFMIAISLLAGSFLSLPSNV